MPKSIKTQLLLLAALVSVSITSWTDRAAAASIESIEVVVVIYAENRSFDHLYGLFPGANGLRHLAPAD